VTETGAPGWPTVSLDPAWRELEGWPPWEDVSALVAGIPKNDMLLRSVWGVMWRGLESQTLVRIRYDVFVAGVEAASGPAKVVMTEALLLAMADEIGGAP